MLVQPYLFFDGRCEEAVQFYRDAIGARLDALMRYRDSPEPLPPGMVPPGFEDRIMHASLRIGDSVLMASDDCSPAPRPIQGVSLSLSVSSEPEADRIFTALAGGGQVTMPLAKTFWSPRFGMLTDRFGVGWMVNVVPPEGG